MSAGKYSVSDRIAVVEHLIASGMINTKEARKLLLWGENNLYLYTSTELKKLKDTKLFKLTGVDDT